MAVVIEGGGEQPSPVTEAAAEATAAVAESEVAIAEIQAERDVAIAETQAEAAVAVAEAEAEEVDELEWLAAQLSASEARVFERVQAAETLILAALEQLRLETAAMISTLQPMPSTPNSSQQAATPAETETENPASAAADGPRASQEEQAAERARARALKWL